MPTKLIGELLHRINPPAVPQARRQPRRSVPFEALDKPALQPLPSERFEIKRMGAGTSEYRTTTWAFDGNFYSVLPYNLVQEAVEIRSTTADGGGAGTRAVA